MCNGSGWPKARRGGSWGLARFPPRFPGLVKIHLLKARVGHPPAGDDAGIDFTWHAAAAHRGPAFASCAAARAKHKVVVSVRLDPQVLAWLRSKGEGHLTRINLIF